MSAALNMPCVIQEAPTMGDVELFHRVNETKCYRLLAIPILDHLCRTRSISDRAFRIWMYLYQVAGSHEDLEVILSYKWMGRRLGKSEATIKRAVKELETAGLVCLTYRFNRHGSQESNCIQVGMPAEELQRITRESPNRRTLQSLEENKKIEKEISEEKQGDNHISGLSETIISNKFEPTAQDNTAACHHSRPSPQALLQAARQHASSPEEARTLYQQFRTSSELQTTLERTQTCPHPPSNADLGSPGRSALPIKNNKQILVEQNAQASALSFTFPTHLPSESLHSHSRRRIHKTLTRMGFKAGQLQRISQEIAFAVTHPLPDSLFARLGIVHSINICLKKAREGQWTTPGHFSEAVF